MFLRAYDIALTSDGVLVMTSSNGLLWLYSPPNHHWLCISTGTTDLSKIAMATSGSMAVVPDRESRLLWVDLDAARKQLLDADR
jgi:hypothetical protein